MRLIFSFSARVLERRGKCRDAFHAFISVQEQFTKMTEKNGLYYDLQSILYSLMPLDVPMVSSHQLK